MMFDCPPEAFKPRPEPTVAQPENVAVDLDVEAIRARADAVASIRDEVDRLRAVVAEVEKMTYASDDGAEWEHVDCCEGEPTCPACWASDIRKALRGGQA